MIYVKYTIKPTPLFEKELENIYKYITFKLQAPITANNLYNKVVKDIYSLEQFPERYPKISCYKNRNLRKLLINKYVVIYEVNNNTRTSFYFTYISL